MNISIQGLALIESLSSMRSMLLALSAIFIQVSALSVLDRMQYGPEYLQSVRGDGSQALPENRPSLHRLLAFGVPILLKKVLPQEAEVEYCVVISPRRRQCDPVEFYHLPSRSSPRRYRLSHWTLRTCVSDPFIGVVGFHAFKYYSLSSATFFAARCGVWRLPINAYRNPLDRFGIAVSEIPIVIGNDGRWFCEIRQRHSWRIPSDLTTISTIVRFTI
jgi:hypothetical protein